MFSRFFKKTGRFELTLDDYKISFRIISEYAAKRDTEIVELKQRIYELEHALEAEKSLNSALLFTPASAGTATIENKDGIIA